MLKGNSYWTTIIIIGNPIIKLMPISNKFTIISLILAITLAQLSPNLQPTTTFTYLPGAYAPPTLVNVPSLTTSSLISAASATPTPTSSPPPTASASPSATTTSPPGSTPTKPSGVSDAISPNPNTLSNVLRNDVFTTNPTASASQNIGYFDYTTANTAFSAVSQIGRRCNGQNIINYVAFKQYSTQFYLTPNLYFLSLLQSSSPSPQQLYTAYQNIDCTWSFKTSDGLYLSLNTAFSYLTLSASLSVGERFYLERKQDWIYIESANSYRYFWTVTNGIVLINLNSASRFVMEMWPNLDAGWN